MASALRQKTAPSGTNYAEGGQDTLGTSTVPWKDVHTVNLTAKGDVVIEGDLTITGESTEVTVSQLAVDETLIKLGKTNTGDSADIGLVGAEDTDGTPVYSGLVRDADNDYWTTFEGLSTDPLSGDGTTVDFSASSLGTIKSKIVSPDGGITLGTIAITSTASEINLLDGVTLGTVQPGLAVVADSNKDISEFRNVSLTSTLTASTVSSSVISGNDAELTLDASSLSTAQFSVKLPEAAQDALSISAGTLDYIVLDTVDSEIQFEKSLKARDITVQDGSTLDVANATLSLASGQISADKISGATFAAGTYSFAGSQVSDLGTVSTVDIDGGSLDDVVIGSSAPRSITASTFVAQGNVDLGNDPTDTLTIAAKVDSDVIPTGNVDLGATDAKWAEAHIVAASVETLTASSDINLSGTLTVDASIDSDLVPEADGTRSLGSSSNRWAQVHADNLTANSLTAGRVVFAGIDGKLVDDADLTFSGSTLTAAKISAGAFASSSVDIDGGTIDGVSIATSNITVGSEKTLDVSGGALTTSAAQKLYILENANSDVDFGSYNVTAATFVGKISTLDNHSTTNLSEGDNLYYTDERVNDRVNSLLIAGEGLDANYDDTAGTLTLSGEDASDTNKGVASFASSDFSVTSGAVSIKSSGVSNAQLENSATTLGTTALTLGSTNTVIDGMDKITANTFSGALEGNADTASALASAFTISVAGDVAGSVATSGTGIAELSLTIQPDSVALGTDTTGNYVATLNESGSNSDFVLDQSNQENGAATIALATISGLTASTYGSATQIPVVEVDTRGRVRSISTADVATSLAFEGDSGADSLALLGGTLTFAGGTALTSEVTGDQVSFALDDTAVTAGTYGAASKSLSLTVDAQGRLTAATHQDIRITHDKITDFDAEVKDLAGALVSGANTSNLSTSYNSSTDQLSISVETATASTLGVASFSSNDFDITTGAVSIKDSAITNAYLANPGFSIEGTTGDGLAGATITPELGDAVRFTAGGNNLVISADDFSNTLDFDLATSISATTITVGSAVLNSADLEKIDEITDGTATANKALVLDVNSSITEGLSSIEASTFTDGTAILNSGALIGLQSLTVDFLQLNGNDLKSTFGDLVLNANSGDVKIASGDSIVLQGTGGITVAGNAIIDGALETDAVKRKITTKTDDYELTGDDHIVLFNASSIVTCTLPASDDSNMESKEFVIKNVHSTNALWFDSDSNIDGSSAGSFTLAAGEKVVLIATASFGWQSI